MRSKSQKKPVKKLAKRTPVRKGRARPIRFRGGVSEASKASYAKGANLAKSLSNLGIIEKKLLYHTQYSNADHMTYKMSNAIKYANYIFGQTGPAGENNFSLACFNGLSQGSSPQQVQGDYVMVKNVTGQLKISLPPVSYSPQNINNDLRQYQPRRFRVLMVMPKLREQPPGVVFSTDDSLFIDRIGREWGITTTDTEVYPGTTYTKTQDEIMNGLVNKQKWIVLKDQKFMLDNPWVQQFYSSTGAHVTGTWGQTAVPVGSLDNFIITDHSNNNVGGYANFPFLQRTGKYASEKVININIPCNKKVKMSNVGGTLNPENLPVLSVRLIIMSDYPAVNRAQNEVINTDTPVTECKTYIQYSGATSFLDA